MSTIQQLFDHVAGAVDGERALRYAEQINGTDRWFTYSAYRRTAQYCAEELRRLGLQDVRIIDLESSGRWGLSGWLLPRAWDCRSASLAVTTPEPGLVVSYEQTPLSLIQHSGPTPPDGLEARLVPFREDQASRADLAGNVAFTRRSATAIQEEVAQAGALGIVTDYIDEFPGVRSRADLPSAHRWVNDAFKPDNAAGLFGFSLNEPQGRHLQELLERQPEVRVRASVDSRLFDDSIGVVTGRLPGHSEQEVLVLGHLYEVGALDNASGTALMLEVAGALARLQADAPGGRVLRRGIRFLFTMEMYGTFGFFDTWGRDRTQRIVAGLNLDAVGGNQALVRCPISYLRTPHSLPSFTNTLMRRVMQLHAAQAGARPTREAPFFETVGGDNMCADPAIGVACASPWQHPSRHWHTSEDTLDTLDPQQLAQMGRVALTYILFAADAGPDEVRWLAAEIEQDGRHVLSQCQDVAEWDHHQELSQRALGSLVALSPQRLPGAVARAQRRIGRMRPEGGLRSAPPDPRVDVLEPYLVRRTMIGVPSTQRVLELLPLAERIAAKPLMARLTDNVLSALIYWCDGRRSLAEAYRRTELEARELASVWSGNASDMMVHELAARAGRRVQPTDVLTAFEMMANLNLLALDKQA